MQVRVFKNTFPLGLCQRERVGESGGLRDQELRHGARSTARGGARCVGGGGRERGGVEWEEETLEKRLALLECWKWRHG